MPVTLARLDRCLGRVQRELRYHGLWTDRLQAVEVVLVPFGVTALGWYAWRSRVIGVPALCLARWAERRRGCQTALIDVLRHEYGHAAAGAYPRLIRSRRFAAAFGLPHDATEPPPGGSDRFVSAYAATSPAEDFAETFAVLLKHRGRLPHRLDTRGTRRKAGFVHDFCLAVAQGRRRW